MDLSHFGPRPSVEGACAREVGRAIFHADDNHRLRMLIK